MSIGREGVNKDRNKHSRNVNRGDTLHYTSDYIDKLLHSVILVSRLQYIVLVCTAAENLHTSVLLQLNVCSFHDDVIGYFYSLVDKIELN